MLTMAKQMELDVKATMGTGCSDAFTNHNLLDRTDADNLCTNSKYF